MPQLNTIPLLLLLLLLLLQGTAFRVLFHDRFFSEIGHIHMHNAATETT